MELNTFEQKFLQLANNIDAVFWLKNPTNTELIYVSPKYEEVWGRNCRDLYEDPLSYFESLHPEDQNFVKDHFTNEQLDKMKFDAEYRIIKPNGEIRWIRDRGFPVTNSDGKIYRCAGMALDITDQKKMEEELKNYQRSLEDLVAQRTQELKKSNELLEEFVGVTSHDLQEPLRKIILFSDRLKTKIPENDEEANNYLVRLQNSAVRMKTLVEDLFQYTKVEAERRPFSEVSLNQVVQDVVEDLEPGIVEKQAEIHFRNLPVIEGDPVKIYQLFLNLVGNAIKFSRKGVSPVIQIEASHQGNGSWEILVKDNGIGIDEKHLQKIFKPFERLHSDRTIGGTGLGLTICDKIVAHHRGHISATQGTPHGAVFRICLPEKQNLC